MPDNDPFVAEYLRATQDARSKYIHYFVALTFTLLALAVESSNFGNNPWSNVAELIGWMFLFASGSLGLLVLKSLPNLYHQVAQKEYTRTQEDELRNIDTTNKVVVAQDPLEIDSAERKVHYPEQLQQKFHIKYKAVSEVADDLASSMSRKGRWQWRTFFLGVTFLLISRAWAPVTLLVEQLAFVVQQMPHFGLFSA